MTAAAARRVAVLDVGKTNVKAVVFDGGTGLEGRARTLPNAVRGDGPYPHFDVPLIADFFADALAGLAAEEGGFDAISITAHGATGALLAGDGLALPVLDYEHDGPDALAEDYDRLRPAFAETFSPRLPGGLNLGAQLHWQAARFPAAFGAATAFVTYPQYWAWWLTGAAATEATSLGCHTDLWAPREGRFSTLVDETGWRPLMAPLRAAFDVLGPVRADLARRLGLRSPVPVLCGLHDSNASLLPHIQGRREPLAVVSTGTWVVSMAAGGTLDRLDPARDTLGNVDAYGRPVPSARFMGGREFDLLTARDAAEPGPADLAAVLARGVMALPSFAPGSGPFPRAAGCWTADPAALSAGERTAAASLYAALMTAVCLDLIEARGPIAVEGPFARNSLYVEALAMLAGRPVGAAAGATGTSAGAARLALPDVPPAVPAPAAAGRHALGAAFARYAARWRAEAGRALNP